MPSPARVAAYEVLRAVSQGREDLPAALVRTRERLRDDRDRALAADISTGTLRWRGQIDHLIATYARRPLDRLDPDVLEVLRLSAYQLLHHERIPASAAVDDAVELTRTIGKKSAAGFVNAVLRAISRSRKQLPLPRRPTPGSDTRFFDDALSYLAISLSHPRWLAARWLRRHGLDDAERWERFNNAPAPLTLRVNTLKIGADDLVSRLRGAGVAVRATRFAPYGLTVIAGNPLRTALADSGFFFVQDEASQLVALVTGARPGDRVLDACASPGGKTAAMAADMQDRGTLIACDFRKQRIGLLRRTIAASGAHSIRIVRADAARPLPFRPEFDVALVDVPCSGLGIIRRDPEIRWRRGESDLMVFASAQQVMLGNAAAVVRPGGRLIYATCSSEPEENDEVIAAFLAAHPEFDRIDLARQTGLTPALRAVVDDEGYLRTSPPRHDLEAFFAAVLCRRR